MPIFLVRHAESQSNIDWRHMRQVPDHEIALTEKGLGQAHRVGAYLSEYFRANAPINKVRLWCSPYLRTTQTAMGLLENATDVPWHHSTHDAITFDDLLREREYGILEGMDENERQQFAPQHFDHYKKLNRNEGKYFAKPYGGESMADVAFRLKCFFGSLMRNIDEGIEDHVIVAHGHVVSCFVLAFLRLHPYFFEQEKNPSNTSVRLLDKNPATGKFADYGVIYDPDAQIHLTQKPQQIIQRDVMKILEKQLGKIKA